MAPRFSRRPGARRPLLALVAVAFVAGATSACLPAELPASSPTAPPTTSVPTPPPPTSIPTPPPGSPDPTTFRCPVDGSSYIDSYGVRPDGSFHYGIDMMAPLGTPEYAVEPGRVWYQVEVAGGNAAYVFADDGNVYYYAHMSKYVGTDRAVKRGDVIGLLGLSGNATTPHLHFEIRVGGANGTRIDPYLTLKAAGC